MKKSYDDIINLRREIFKEVARMAYDDEGVGALEDAAFRIRPGEVAQLRSDLFHERAVIEERLRLAMGMGPRKLSAFKRVTDGFDEIDVDHNVYSKPLINILTFGCEACPPRQFYVTDNCRKCMAKPCVNVCPVKAVRIDKERAVIDTEVCIKCGQCLKNCPFHAIVEFDRPCAASCGVQAIGSDEYGRAEIDHEKCVACGHCVTQCPFGAIADKSQIYQLVKALKDPEKRVYAMVAPSFVGQFGANVGTVAIFEAIKAVGFEDVVEVALGADITTLNEAKEFLERVPKEIPFMGTSCCYSWALLVQENFPELADDISDTGSPMIYTGQFLLEQDPDAILCFIGPCTSKKLEALDPKVRAYIEFVITFEELSGIFASRGIDPGDMQVTGCLLEASALGRGYAAAGGVAKSVKETAEKLDPQREVKVVGADSLGDCVKLLKKAKAGAYNGYLLEGMACPGGCIAGMGTLESLPRATRALTNFMKESAFVSAFENDVIQKDVDAISNSDISDQSGGEISSATPE